jgi:fucose permease
MESTHLISAGSRRTLALACGVFLAAGVTLAGLGPALPHLAAHVGYDIAALGWLFTAISAGVVLAQVAAGSASDRHGQRPVMSAGMLLMSCGTLGVSLGGSLVTLLISALLAGVGFGCVLAAGNVLVARLFPTNSAAALNGVNLFFGVGSMLGPMVAGLAGARLGIPQAALWVGAGLLLALAPTVLGRAVRPPTQAVAAYPKSAAPRAAAFWLLGLLMLIYTGTEVGFGAWVTVYMINSTNLAPAAAALVASSFWLALTIGRALGALLGLRMRSQTLLVVSLLGILSGAAILTIGVGDLGRSAAGVLLIGLMCGPVFPTVLSVVTSTARESGAAASLVLALGNCGGLIIPALLGLLLSRYGSMAAAGLVFAAALTMVALYGAVMWLGAAANRSGAMHETQL